MGFMAIVNLIAILLLGKWAFKVLMMTRPRRRPASVPVFVADNIEGLPKTECWHIGSDDLEDVGPQPVKEYFEEAIDAGGDSFEPLRKHRLKGMFYREGPLVPRGAFPAFKAKKSSLIGRIGCEYDSPTDA